MHRHPSAFDGDNERRAVEIDRRRALSARHRPARAGRSGAGAGPDPGRPRPCQRVAALIVADFCSLLET